MPVPSQLQILRARRVITPSQTPANGIAFVNGRIVAVGDADDLLRRFPHAEMRDGGDAVISPGFNDAHLHLALAAEDELSLNVSPSQVSSLTELCARVAAAAAAADRGLQGWIRAVGYDDAKMRERRTLTRWDLDAVTGAIPTIVIHVSAHWAVVNSAALAAGNITDRSEPPPGGDFGRDGNGRLNGVLYERAFDDFAYGYRIRADGQSVVPPIGLTDRLSAVEHVIKRWHSAGITSVCDALVGPDDIRLFATAREQGILTMRVGFLLAAEHYDEIHRLGLRSGFGDDHLRFVGVKAFVDGAIAGRTCLLEGPTHHEHRGIQVLTPAEVRDVVARVHGDDNRVCLHANGDRAINSVLDELEHAHSSHPKPALRHRIEHCSVVNDDILRRMHAMSVIAIPLANYVYEHGANLIEWYGAERLEWMFAHRAFLDAGVTVGGSSDFPCSAVEPLLAMQSMVTRVGWDGAVVGPSQRISAAEALSIYSAGSAAATGEDGSKGTLAAGQAADFVLLENDPREVPSDHISRITVQSTYVAGEAVYSRT